MEHARVREAHSVSQAIPAFGANKAACVPRSPYLICECDLPIVARGAKCQLAGAAHLRTTDRTFEAETRLLPNTVMLAALCCGHPLCDSIVITNGTTLAKTARHARRPIRLTWKCACCHMLSLSTSL